MRREDEAGRDEDGQMIPRSGQTEQWLSVNAFDKGQATMEIVGTQSDLRLSAISKLASKQ